MKFGSVTDIELYLSLQLYMKGIIYGILLLSINWNISVTHEKPNLNGWNKGTRMKSRVMRSKFNFSEEYHFSRT